MASLRTLTQAHRHLLLLVFACAMLARAIVPTGWMPIASPGGGVTLGLCSGMGPGAMVHSAAKMHHSMPASHDRTSEHPCAFAGVAAALESPALPMPLPLALPRAARPSDEALADAVGRGLAAPPPPQTGPPLLI